MNSEFKQALKWFEQNNIEANVDDGSIFVTVLNHDFDVFEIQVSTSEISYRAELYKDKEKMSRAMQYTVWVGGTEIGTYATRNEAEQVWSDWKDDGYQHLEIDEWFTDEDTPEEQNNRLLSIGY